MKGFAISVLLELTALFPCPKFLIAHVFLSLIETLAPTIKPSCWYPFALLSHRGLYYTWRRREERESDSSQTLLFFSPPPPSGGLESCMSSDLLQFRLLLKWTFSFSLKWIFFFTSYSRPCVGGKSQKEEYLTSGYSFYWLVFSFLFS